MFQRTRHIPLPLLIRMFFESDFLLLFGWIFFTIGSIIFCVFALLSDFSSLVLSKDSPQAQAVIFKIEYANAQENRARIYAYHYKFQVDGKEYEGISYGFSSDYQEGDTATVVYVYKSNKPTYSRIVNLRQKHFSPFFLIFIAIFPLIVPSSISLIMPAKWLGVILHSFIVCLELLNRAISSFNIQLLAILGSL